MRNEIPRMQVTLSFITLTIPKLNQQKTSHMATSKGSNKLVYVSFLTAGYIGQVILTECFNSTPWVKGSIIQFSSVNVIACRKKATVSTEHKEHILLQHGQLSKYTSCIHEH